MGMFDDPKPFSENFQEGETFRLEAAKIGNEMNTAHGPGTPVLLKIGGDWFSLFGEGVKNQVERMDAGDLPANVRLDRVPTKSGNTVKILVPADRPAPDEAPGF